ncbi:hypothetical protein GW765_04400 [Candidatus Parcubacteria bacterium]|nr:hypothetical protein [Candidatus Parcubacteria bacterium]
MNNKGPRLKNDFYKRITEWVNEKEEGETITSSEVALALNLKVGTVATFLMRRSKDGYLKNVSKTKRKAIYEIADKEIPMLELFSKGELSDLIFKILQEASLDLSIRCISEGDIAMNIQERTGKNASIDSVHTAIHRWLHEGYLTKEDDNGHGYGVRYGLKKKYLHSKTRPFINRRKKTKK